MGKRHEQRVKLSCPTSKKQPASSSSIAQRTPILSAPEEGRYLPNSLDKMMTLRQHLLPLLCLGGAGIGGALGRHVSHVDIPGNLSTRALVRDAYGYSVEPVWLSWFVNTTLMTTLLGEIANVTGKAPPIRIGGTTSDKTTLYASLPGNITANGTSQFNITSGWFDSFAGYFPQGTDLIFCLNFADNTSAWMNARDTAAAAWESLGAGSGSTSNLVMFELGNEIDHFIGEKWRAPGWGVEQYIPQFDNLTASIQQAEWYVEAEEEGEAPPKFQAAVFADPPWVPVCSPLFLFLFAPPPLLSFPPHTYNSLLNFGF